MKFEELNIQFQLHVDEMYWSAAVDNLAVPRHGQHQADAAKERLQSLDWYTCYLANDLGDEIDFSVVVAQYELSGDDIREVVEVEQLIRQAYRVYLQALAATHIFCGATLEAHIHCRANEMLRGRSLNEFDRLSLEAKWLFFPLLVGLSDHFDPGIEPFQSFSQLITYRNRLVHYKGHEPSKWTNSGPQFDVNLGLSTDAAERSVQAAEQMIRKLYAAIGKRSNRSLGWLDHPRESYFDFALKRP